MTTFSAALVGCGNVSRMHFEGLALHPERVRVVAACDPDAERREWARSAHGVPVTVQTIDELLAEHDFDVAVVLTPTIVREDVVRRLAAAGKHVFVEKPLADSRKEAERMVRACSDAGVRLSVDQNFRTHYGFGVAGRAIADGRIGEPVSIVHTDLMFRQDSGWRTGTERHALSVMGVHWLDGFRHMLGREAESVTARTWSSPAVECRGETDALVQVAFAGGAVASYAQSFSSPVKRTETIVIGEEGALRLDYDSVQLSTRDGGSEPVETWPNECGGEDKPESAFRALDELLTAIETGGEAGNSGRDNLRTIALLEACYRSAAQGRTVALGEGGLP